jgi:hypothetical protein
MARTLKQGLQSIPPAGTPHHVAGHDCLVGALEFFLIGRRRRNGILVGGGDGTRPRK